MIAPFPRLRMISINVIEMEDVISDISILTALTHLRSVSISPALVLMSADEAADFDRTLKSIEHFYETISNLTMLERLEIELDVRSYLTDEQDEAVQAVINRGTNGFSKLTNLRDLIFHEFSCSFHSTATQTKQTRHALTSFGLFFFWFFFSVSSFFFFSFFAHAQRTRQLRSLSTG
jgi:hypothetical protein